jgi:hypothetical protein
MIVAERLDCGSLLPLLGALNFPKSAGKPAQSKRFAPSWVRNLFHFIKTDD